MAYRVVAKVKGAMFTSAPMTHSEAIQEASDIVARTGNATDVRIVSEGESENPYSDHGCHVCEALDACYCGPEGR